MSALSKHNLHTVASKKETKNSVVITKTRDGLSRDRQFSGQKKGSIIANPNYSLKSRLSGPQNLLTVPLHQVLQR